MAAKFLAFCLLLSGFVGGPESADVLISRANKDAVKGDRRVLIHFGASWCGPCRVLAKFLHEGKVGQILGKYFVIVGMDVDETPEKQGLENPGAAAMRTRYLGEKAPLPSFIILDKEGKMLSFGEGCPSGYSGIKPFLKVLATGNPKITTDDLWTLRREMEARL